MPKDGGHVKDFTMEGLFALRLGILYHGYEPHLIVTFIRALDCNPQEVCACRHKFTI